MNMLGRGGFACVYRARSIKTGQEVAIKMVRVQNVTSIIYMYYFIIFMYDVL